MTRRRERVRDAEVDTLALRKTISALPASLPSEGGIFDGKYRIGAVLGIGGMAAVVAAKHLGFDETVAIKVLLPDCCDDAAVVARFVQEGKTASKIHSEHVVRMLDVGVVAGRAYLVMEYLDGEDFEALLRRRGPLPLDTAVDLLLQACEGMGEAHVLGIVHRDLKPSNLFLTHRADGSPCVKVLDFGISKMPRSVSNAPPAVRHPTLPALVMGSPPYMSPEQMVSAAMADARADIWSLGAILYELLTDRVAFEGGTTAEICARVLQGAPSPLESIRADLPSAVGRIVFRCLEKAPSSRYANVADLARALAPFGSAAARASAESIARVVEGAAEAPWRSRSVGGTIRPTAAEILAPEQKARRRISGYVVGGVLSLMALGIGATGAIPRVVQLHRSRAVAAPSAMPIPPAVPAASSAHAASSAVSDGHLRADGSLDASVASARAAQTDGGGVAP